ncbi:ADP-ribose pyrophosphatase [Alcanivorax hongdengensis A-11-3]|uniref:ADP-ribose pyrophosphatase n=1 Tax=Alcanivorax hongdengensis A-11-3 TaxID=1177179 RepID=L0WG84_9GAMM|nr:NUDIX domain-containing protein [Alcanivorax hongdengensis]EKF76016.1 ADP-ribose pyrophosphatase [Alcanivorax hongdengensis A-11-3]
MTDIRPPFGPEDVEILERETPFQGFFRLDTLTLRHRLYQGGWSGPIRRELFVRHRAAAVLPYDADNGLILLVEQFRVGALEWRDSPWCLELIAGLADKDGESAADLIRREAVEEGGLTLGEMLPVTRYMPSPGGTNERLEVFLGQADLSQAGGYFGQADEGEDIRALTVPVDDIPALLDSGRMDNAASIIALQWLLLHRERIDARWRRR